MPRSAERVSFDRSVTAVAVILFHVAIVAVLLNAIPKYSVRLPPESETIISLIPQRTAAPRVVHRAMPGSTAPSRYDYRFVQSPSEVQPNLQGLNLALSSCAPQHLGSVSEEVRAACRRIGLVVAANPEAFGPNPNYKNGARWEKELAIKQSPLLLPCASPYGVDVFFTLFCIAGLVEDGYDPDKMQRYSK